MEIPVTRFYTSQRIPKSARNVFYRFPSEWLESETCSVKAENGEAFITPEGDHKVVRTSSGKYGRVKIAEGLLPEGKYAASLENGSIVLRWRNV